MRPRATVGSNNNLLGRAAQPPWEKTMVHSMNDNNPLSGVTVLVVEDDLFLAMDLEDTLVGMGAVVVDVCHTLDEAMAWADADDFAVAVLDFSLGSDSVTPLGPRLRSREHTSELLTSIHLYVR